MKKINKLLYKQSNPNKSLPSEIIDVTIPIQAMVNKSQLHLGSYSKVLYNNNKNNNNNDNDKIIIIIIIIK